MVAEATLKLKFSRPVNYVADYISPGSYEVELKDGSVKRFDFYDSEHFIDPHHQNIVTIILKNIDTEDFDHVNMDDIKNIRKFIEFFIGINDTEDNPLDLIEVTEFSFAGRDGMNHYVEYNLPPEVIKSANEHICQDHNI